MELSDGYSSYATLKADVSDAVIAALTPVQRAYAEIRADPAELDRILTAGSERARALAAPTLSAMRRAMGLRPV